MRGGARRRRLDGAGRLGGGGKRRRGCSGEDWARGSGLGVARGRGAANGGGYWGGAGLWLWLRGGVSSPGFGVVRRRRSKAWEREGSKRERGIAFWGFCRARALARRVRRALPGTVHGDGEVEAAWAALEAAGRVARLGRLQREATGGGGGRPRRVGASARRINGRNGREGVGGENRAGRWEMVIRVDL